MTIKNRIAQLEKQSGAHAVNKYMCMYYKDAENNPLGYRVQPYAPNMGAAFELATLQELDEFEKRADVDLIRVVIQYASEAKPISTYTQGNYSFAVGVDMNNI